MLLLLTVSQNCVLLLCLHQKNESSVCLKISRFTPWENDGECTDVTFSYTSRWLISPDAKYILFSKQQVLDDI